MNYLKIILIVAFALDLKKTEAISTEANNNDAHPENRICYRLEEIRRKIRFSIDFNYPWYMKALQDNLNSFKENFHKNQSICDINKLNEIVEQLRQNDMDILNNYYKPKSCHNINAAIVADVIDKLSILFSNCPQAFDFAYTFPTNNDHHLHPKQPDFNSIFENVFDWKKHLQNMSKVLDTDLNLYFFHTPGTECLQYFAFMSYASINDEKICNYSVSIHLTEESPGINFESVKPIQNYGEYVESNENFEDSFKNWMSRGQCSIYGFTIKFDDRFECSTPIEFIEQNCLMEKAILTNAYKYLSVNFDLPNFLKKLTKYKENTKSVMLGNKMKTCFSNYEQYVTLAFDGLTQLTNISYNDIEEFFTQKDICNWYIMQSIKIHLYLSELFSRCRKAS